jgi:hypothetical protein
VTIATPAPDRALPSAVGLRDDATARRVIGLVCAVGATAVLVIAALLEPSPVGLGTHQRLGAPPCGWIVTMDLPCPTCGMTTAFAHAADGRFLASLRAQPLGFALAVATAIALLVGAYTTVTGSRLALVFGRLWTRRTGWGLAGVVVLAWIYKLLTHRGLIP